MTLPPLTEKQAVQEKAECSFFLNKLRARLKRRRRNINQVKGEQDVCRNEEVSG